MKILLVALFGVASTAYAADVRNPADCYTTTYSEVPRTITPIKKRVHKRAHVPTKKHVRKKHKHTTHVAPIYQQHKTWYECPPPPQSVPVIPNTKPPILIPPGLWYYPGPNVYIPPTYPLIPPEPIVPIFPAPPYYWFPYLPWQPPQYVPPVAPPVPPTNTPPEIPFPVPPGYWPPNMPPPDIPPPKPPDNPYYPPVYVPPITVPPTDSIPPNSPTYPNTPPTDVPEPSTVALFGIALFALFLSRKRK